MGATGCGTDLFWWLGPCSVQFISLQSLSLVQLFATPWTAALQASLSITNSRSLLKLMSIESVMPSNHLILCHPLFLLPSIFLNRRAFPMSWPFASGGQSIGASASASVFPMNTQDWFPLQMTVWSCSTRDSYISIFLEYSNISHLLSRVCYWYKGWSSGSLTVMWNDL